MLCANNEGILLMEEYARMLHKGYDFMDDFESFDFINDDEKQLVWSNIQKQWVL